MRTDKECVNWTAENGVATIAISNPPVNALNKTVRDDFTKCLGEITGDGSIRVVILTGAGRAFIAGPTSRSCLNSGYLRPRQNYARRRTG